MRPREIPAEAAREPSAGSRPTVCFNEAAGDPRGSRPGRDRDASGRFASMRPREIPAEAVYANAAKFFESFVLQ